MNKIINSTYYSYIDGDSTVYKDSILLLNGEFVFKGILSKTVSFKIAKQFSLGQNYFNPHYFIFYYPKNSKHVGLDIKPEKYDEYEYLMKRYFYPYPLKLYHILKYM